MKISEQGIQLIKKFEGCRLSAYKDVVGILTIGYGHTGPDVTDGLKISQTIADALLINDLKHVEACIVSCVSFNITQAQFDALCSFIFNVGASAFRHSHLLLKLNAGDIASAANEFLRWDRAGGRIIPDLSRRRQSERSLFLS